MVSPAGTNGAASALTRLLKLEIFAELPVAPAMVTNAYIFVPEHKELENARKAATGNTSPKSALAFIVKDVTRAELQLAIVDLPRLEIENSAN
jgi:hypothetical protein